MKLICLTLIFAFICLASYANQSKIIFKRRMQQIHPFYSFALSALKAIVGGDVRFQSLEGNSLRLGHKIKSCINKGFYPPINHQIKQEFHFSNQYINSHLAVASRFLSISMVYKLKGKFVRKNLDSIVYNVCKLKKHSIPIVAGNYFKLYLGKSIVPFVRKNRRKTLFQNTWMIRIKVTNKIVLNSPDKNIKRIRPFTKPLKSVFTQNSLEFMNRVLCLLTPILKEFRAFFVGLYNSAPLFKRAIQMFDCLKKLNIIQIEKQLNYFTNFILAARNILLNGWPSFVKLIIGAMCNDWSLFKSSLLSYMYAVNGRGNVRYSLLGTFVGRFVIAIGKSYVPPARNKRISQIHNLLK